VSVRRHFIAGLVVIAPITVTAVVVWWIFQRVDGLLGQFVYPLLPFRIPGLGVALLFALLVAIGWLAERAIGSRIIAWWHALLERIPLFSRIYFAANRITTTVFGRDSRPFQAVVAVEYPSDGRWTLGFLSSPVPDGAVPDSADAVTIFIPTSPNPTSGFLVMVPRARVRVLEMTVDEAFTWVLSAGSVRPGMDGAAARDRSDEP
jgi:uncharacterized membrane protein